MLTIKASVAVAALAATAVASAGITYGVTSLQVSVQCTMPAQQQPNGMDHWLDKIPVPMNAGKGF